MTSAFSTSAKALWIEDSYDRSAALRAASAWRTWPEIAPAVKIGPVTDPPKLHVFDGPLKRSDSSSLARPKAPVSEMEGKYSGPRRAICAMARSAPAPHRAMSGRRSSTRER